MICKAATHFLQKSTKKAKEIICRMQEEKKNVF